MYKSLVEIWHSEMEVQMEGEVLKACQRVGVQVDRDELLKALQYDRNQYNKGYDDGFLDGAFKDDWIPCEDEEEPCITKEFAEECKEVAKKYKRPIMRDDFGRCKMRGCNLCDKYRKELEADKWIPCETELPPQPNENPLYENKPLEVYLVSVENWEEPIRAFWNGNDFTDGWSKLKVEAWMPLPQPYKKEGAE